MREPDFTLRMFAHTFRNEEKQERVANKMIKSLVKGKFTSINVDYKDGEVIGIQAWKEARDES